MVTKLLVIVIILTPVIRQAVSLARLSAAAAPEVGAVTSVQPALCVRQQLFWSSTVRGGGEETRGSYGF